MEIVTIIIQILAVLSGFLTALLSILIFVRLKWPAPVLWLLKLYVSALSPVFVLIGLLNCIVGLATGSIFICLIGIYDILIFCSHIFFVTRPPDKSSNFEKAFGQHWEQKIDRGIKNKFLSSRISLMLPLVPDTRLQQNISFATIPGTNEKLLCDIWQPQKNVPPSGLAFIYMHGGAWYMLDKDVNTRPFFRHLSAQGHVIMDVAYRLAPEVDMMGMVHDVKWAINWMKENAVTYGIDPNRIVVGGGSSGAHLALMAAYTANKPEFSPKELEGKDLGVSAVISIYGPADLEPMYYHTNQHLTTRSASGKPQRTAPAHMPDWIIKKMGNDYHRLHMDKVNAVTFALLLGGHPDECRKTYALFSPVTHVHAHCPPTLLIHGEHDLMAPVKSSRVLFSKLIEKKVKTVMHILTQTDHGFDLQLPKISPSAHNALFDVERFLALMARQKKTMTTNKSI